MDMRLYICDTVGADPRAARLPGRSAGHGSALAHSLLAWALERDYGILPPEIAVDGCGKPYFPGRPDIFFSLSHSRGHVLAAVADCPVGADVEDAGRAVSAAFVSRLMSPREQRDFAPLELWVLRESLFKLRGSGDLRGARFSLEGAAPVCPGSDAFFRLYVTAGFVCAVAADRDILPAAPVAVPAALLLTSPPPCVDPGNNT